MLDNFVLLPILTACHSTDRLKQKKLKMATVGSLDPDWKATINKRAAKASSADNDDSMVQFGGPIPEGETDEIEAKAMKANKSSALLLSAGKPYVASHLLFQHDANISIVINQD